MEELGCHWASLIPPTPGVGSPINICPRSKEMSRPRSIDPRLGDQGISMGMSMGIVTCLGHSKCACGTVADKCLFHISPTYTVDNIYVSILYIFVVGLVAG